MINWWLNLDRFEQAAKMTELICRPDARAHKNLKKIIFRSRITDENSLDISAHHEPALTIVSSAYTPDKPCKPRTEARVSIFSREPPGLATQYERLAHALNIDPDISFDSLDGNAIVNSLEKAGFNLFFTPDEWPGETYFAFISLDIERCWLLLSLGLLLPVDTSTRTMIATARTANHHQLVKLRERLLKTCGRYGGCCQAGHLSTVLSTCLGIVYSSR